MIITKTLAVTDGPVGEDGGKAVTHGIHQWGRTPNVEIGFLLAGE